MYFLTVAYDAPRGFALLIKVIAGLAIVTVWVALTLVTVVAYNEWKLHGEEHAFVKQLQAREAEHAAEHAALRQLIQMVNEQARRQQPAEAPQAQPARK